MMPSSSAIDAEGDGLFRTEFLYLDREGERIGADTPSRSRKIPVTNVPSYVHQAWEIA